MGSMPNEEYIPCAIELVQLEKDDPTLFETYWELMYHFYISLGVHNARGIANGMKNWPDYLFPVLDDVLREVQFPI